MDCLTPKPRDEYSRDWTVNTNQARISPTKVPATGKKILMLLFMFYFPPFAVAAAFFLASSMAFR